VFAPTSLTHEWQRAIDGQDDPFQVASQRVLPALDGQVLKGLAGRPGAAHQHGVVHQYV
jgi:hypothetical protein